jgi:hypothetical protein
LGSSRGLAVTPSFTSNRRAIEITAFSHLPYVDEGNSGRRIDVPLRVEKSK